MNDELIVVPEHAEDVRNMLQRMIDRGFQPRLIVGLRDNDRVVDCWLSDSLSVSEHRALVRSMLKQLERRP
jgi:hypothetical protein